MLELLVCPTCKTVLTQCKDNSLHCENCGVVGIVGDGVYDFAGDRDFFFGKESPEEMESTLQCARARGWRAAGRELAVRHRSTSVKILSNARIDWLFHCLDFSRTKACLDFGSGWGTMAFGLAQYYDEVWSVEAYSHRLAFQRIRQEQESVDNIRFVRSDSFQLPFPDDHFDLVVSSGVLEWLGLSDYTRSPREVQLDFLKEVKRVLKPGGCLYIGIENRFGFQFFLGSTDHSGLRYTSLLPRRLANLVVRLRRREGGTQAWNQIEKWNDYRTYTYGLGGYQRILREAGFTRTVPYWTLDYSDAKYSGRFDGESYPFLIRKLLAERSGQGMSTRAFLASVGARLPRGVINLLLQIVSPCFLLYAYKGDSQPPFEADLLCLGAPASGFLKVGGSHSRSSKVIYFLLKDGKVRSVLKFPRFVKLGARSVATEEAKLAQFNQLNIRRQRVDGVEVFVEPPISGVRPQPHNLAHNRMVLSWLLDFQQRTEKEPWTGACLERGFAPLFEFLSEIAIGEDVRSRTRKRLETFATARQHAQLCVTAEHGGLAANNILIGDDGRVYVLDWENYREEGEPLFDFVLFLCTNARGSAPEFFRDNFLGKGRYSPILETLMAEFADAKRLPPELLLQGVPYVILRVLHRLTTGPDNRHLNVSSYLSLLVMWDEICRSPYSPYTRHVSKSQRA